MPPSAKEEQSPLIKRLVYSLIKLGVKGVDHQKIAKLDRETEELSHEKLGLSVAKAIQQARQEKKLTQKELAIVFSFYCNIVESQ